MKPAEITVTRRGAERVREGHLWVYRSDVLEPKGVPAGAVVRVVDERRKLVGQALFSDQSQITLRFLTTRDESIDRDWWRGRIRAAAARREKFKQGTNAYRLIYSEGDLLSSLIVDHYDGVLVMQTLSQGMEAQKELLAELLAEEFAPRAIIERNDVRVRELEGLKLQIGVLYGEAPDEIEIEQDGVRFSVSPLSGQKTGSFLDQRENRLAARNLSRGRALDCFTFDGGFALHLAKTCVQVLGLDVSSDAVVAARRNALRNDLSNVEFREANVFDALHELDAEGERFDTIVLDPPAFAKNRASVKPAARGYKEINLRALKLLNPGGVLVTCTCSYHMSEEMFLALIAEAARDAHRRVQLVERRMQSSDHPVLLGMPETHYLKCMILRCVE